MAVVHGSPAADAGILPGDFIVSVDGKPVIDTVHSGWMKDKQGKLVAVTIARGGSKINKTVKLATL